MKFVGTVRLRPSISGVRLLGWREEGKAFKPFGGSCKVPYELASFLRLMPKDGWTEFSNILYDFSTQEFNELKAGGSVLKVTKRHSCTFVTIDTSK